MRLRRGVGYAVMVALVIASMAARAAGDAAPSLPTLALEPAPEPSIWHGLSVGAEVIGVSSRHGGGFGGDVFATYDHAFANNVVLGISGSTGSMPGFGRSTLYHGFDFAAADVRIGYDMGRVMPYVTGGVILARPHGGLNLSTPGADSLNLVLNGGSETRTLSRVGVGVHYAVTNNLTVGVAVSAVQGRFPLVP